VILKDYPQKDSYKIMVNLSNGNDSDIDTRKPKELRANNPLA
jgi:hypothetical protein